jgi:hypothetical protein
MMVSPLYKKLADWFLNQPDVLIPKDEDPFFQAVFDTTDTFDLRGYDLKGVLNKDQYDSIECDMVNLPLLVAYQAGVRDTGLEHIARNHPIDVVSLVNTLDEIHTKDYEWTDSAGKIIASHKVYIELVRTLSRALPDELSRALSRKDEYSDLHMVCLHSENPADWPVTRIAEKMKRMEAGVPEEAPFLDDGVFNINTTMTTDDYMPKDASGTRYDIFLERSGMLLPEVASKKFGSITLWEDMLDVAKDEDGEGMSGLFNYCINNPPEHLRPGIFRGLSGMVLDVAIHLNDGKGLVKMLWNSVIDSWLEPLRHNPHLIISLMGADNLFTVRSVKASIDANNSAQASGVPSPVQSEAIFEHCLNALLDVDPEEMGASYFQLYHLADTDMPEPVFSAGFRPEPIIVHMLKGFEHLSLRDIRSHHKGLVVDDLVLRGCNYVIDTLAKRFELDYMAFSGLNSNSVRVLAEAGLDKRRLPRMNVRDRGHLVSQELGL